MPGPASRPALQRELARSQQGTIPSGGDAAQPLRPPASLPFPALPLLPIPMPSSPCPPHCRERPPKARSGPWRECVCVWWGADPHVLLSLGRVLPATHKCPKTEPIPLAAESRGLTCSPPSLAQKVQKDDVPCQVPASPLPVDGKNS